MHVTQFWWLVLVRSLKKCLSAKLRNEVAKTSAAEVAAASCLSYINDSLTQSLLTSASSSQIALSIFSACLSPIFIGFVRLLAHNQVLIKKWHSPEIAAADCYFVRPISVLSGSLGRIFLANMLSRCASNVLLSQSFRTLVLFLFSDFSFDFDYDC